MPASTLVDISCGNTVTRKGRVTITRKPFPGKRLYAYKQLETGYLISAQMAGRHGPARPLDRDAVAARSRLET